MVPKNTMKPKRQKKRKSRTEVSSDSDSSEPESRQTTPEATATPAKVEIKTKASSPDLSSSSSSSSSTPEPTTKKHKTDAQIQAAFTNFYLAQATKEFGEDLDKLRNAHDFKDEHLGLLVEALKQGTSLFGKEEMRRVVEAGED